MPKKATKKAVEKIAAAAPPLYRLTPQQARFCELVIGGMRDVPAYMEAYSSTRANAEMNAWRLKDLEGVRATIQAARAEPWGESVLTMEKKRAFLLMVVETENGDVDQNSILCQSYKRTRRTEGRGDDAEEWETEEIKLPDKLRAIELDAKLAGEFTEKVEHTVQCTPEVQAALRSMFSKKP